VFCDAEETVFITFVFIPVLQVNYNLSQSYTMIVHALLLVALLSSAEAFLLPSTMRAVLAKGTSKELNVSAVVEYVADRDVPKPGIGEILIAINASSVNPVDWKVLEGGLPLKFPHVLGFDASGVVVAKGSLTSDRLNVGDEVWCDLGKTWLLKGGGELGAYAEFAVADESQVGLKPTSMSFGDAAVIPLVGLTTLQAFEKMKNAVDASEWPLKTVVVTSGSGGTGMIGIQMAKAYGATKVVTACGPSNLDYCKSLGADVVVDYTKSKTALWDALDEDSVDAVYDNFGAPGTADLAMPSLKKGGVFLFLPGKDGAVSKHPKEGVHQLNFGLADASHYSDLDKLRDLVDKGLLRAHVSQTFALERTADAFETSIQGKVVGKLGIAI